MVKLALVNDGIASTSCLCIPEEWMLHAISGERNSWRLEEARPEQIAKGVVFFIERKNG